MAAVGAVALVTLLGLGVWQMWLLRTGEGMLARATPTALPVPTYTSTPEADAAVAASLPLTVTSSAPEAPVATVTDAIAAAPEPETPATATPVPPLEAVDPLVPAVRTITLDDIAPGSADSPRPTPAPPTPTPTVPPTVAEQLTQGIQLHRLGDYVAARARLAALINDPATDQPVRAEARFYLAKGYLADGYYSEALAALDLLDDEFATAVTANARPGPVAGSPSGKPTAARAGAGRAGALWRSDHLL